MISGKLAFFSLVKNNVRFQHTTKLTKGPNLAHMEAEVGVCRVRVESSHKPPEPLALESGRVILGFDFRTHRVNYKFFESTSS